MSNIVNFPKIHTISSSEEVLEAAKGWDFETVFVFGNTKEGGSSEGTVIISTNEDNNQTAKNLLFMAELLKFTALKQLGFL